jgi:hypothetical protein
VTPELARAREWAAALATGLDDVVAQADAVARRMAEGWPDPRGGEWVERLRLVRRGIDRDAADAHELGRTIDRVAQVQADPLPAGPQLGGTAGRHVDDRRGVTIPQLGDTPG